MNEEGEPQEAVLKSIKNVNVLLLAFPFNFSLNGNAPPAAHGHGQGRYERGGGAAGGAVP